EHRALVNHLAWSRRYFAVTPADAMAFSGTLSFDVTMHQLFVPLVCGARLVVVPEGEQRDPDAMAATLRSGGVTLLHVVPALLRLLTDSPVLAEVTTLRAVVSAGEALTNNLRRRFTAAHPARLYNAYGPTEATIYATVFDAGVAPGRWAAQADVPIGRPLDNVVCHVLDESLRPVPPGAPGELCLSGVALAAGYHDDPQRTAEQFVEADAGDGPVRLYRTGDLVRRLGDGELSYLGRLDHQVKLNGFRVELGEVEAAMLDAAGVRDAVAVVRRPDEGHAQLVGYVTPDTVDVGALRACVAERLPAYMVPARLVALSELPRLPSGKADRKALPPPPATPPGQAAQPGAVPAEVAPPGRVLGLVRDAWTAMLGAPAGDDAHFFASGGDSILAMRLVAELRRAGLALDLRLLHAHPVLTDLAAALGAGTGTDRAAAPGAGTGADGTAVPGAGTGPQARHAAALAPIQRWFLDTVHTDRHQWNQSVLLRLTAPADPALLGMALQALVLAHPELSARLDGDRMARAEPFTAMRPAELYDTVTVASAEERDAAIREVQRSLDPAAGILVRARLLHDPASGTDLLLVVVHHLVVDGVSWRILLGDLDAAVTALHRGELPRMPAESRSYRAWLAGLPGVAADEPTAAYWRTVVRRRHAAGALLRAAPAGREGDSDRLERHLDPATTAALLGPVPAALGLPVHDVLTGLVALALARWRGCTPVTLDVEGHGRDTDGELARTVGWFTALYPVVLDVDRTHEPAAHLRAVRAQLAAVPHGGASHGAVRSFAPAAQVRDELAAAPPALVSFNYLGRLDADLAGSRFEIVGSPVPEDRSPRAERPHTVELYGLVRDGRLTVGATYAAQPVDGVDGPAVTALLDHLAGLCRALVSEAAEPVEVPITAQQYGILVDSLARRGTGRYVEQLSWVWQGPLDLDRFRAAWRHAAGRHAALRSAFRWDEQARVVVHARVEPEVRVVTDGPWERVLQEDRARDFDPARPPLFRLTVRPGEERHRVLFSFHHALLDGWSAALVLEDFYRAYLHRPRPEDPAEPDARDHARWLAEQDTTDAEAFWSSRLCERQPATRPGVPGPAAPGTGVGRHEVRLPRAELTGLFAAAAQRSATESTVLQSLWAALLWRATGTAAEAPVCFGVTLSGRAIDLPGADRVAGLLMTTLPLVVEVRPDEPVLELMARTRAAALEMSTFEWVSTGQVHDWSGRHGGTPLFESLLVVENYPSDLGDVGELLAGEGVRVHGMSGTGGETAYPCTVLVHHDGDDLVLTVVHDRRAVDDTAARRIGELWRTVLRELAARPGSTVAELAGAVPDDMLPVLARPAPPATSGGSPGQWPPGPHTELVREVWGRVLGVAEVAPDDHFFFSGGHSLLASRFLREIQERCDRPVRLDDLLTHPTAAAFAQVLAGAPADAGRSTVVPLAPGVSPAVYLLHPPGGQVACYGEFARHYPGAEALFGLRDPRADRPGPPPDWTVRELAERHLRELGPRLGSGPVVLGGFSGGGVVAHEMACLVHERTGATPLVLIVDAAAPTGRVTDTAAEGSFLRRVADHDRAGADGGAGTPATGDAYLDELATVAEWMRGAGHGDPYALLACTLNAVERHRPRPYPGPVVLLRAADTGLGVDGEFTVDDYYALPDMGWGGLCGDLSVQTVAGNHITLLTGEQARGLAGTVAAIVRHHKGRDAR
ncbi:condensation domain-containing protein, partial [Couchioplanes azureus]